MNGGDKRLEADSADDLFEGAVVVVGRDEEGADRDLRESSRFSLVRRRSPRPAAEAA